jgi:O-antigen/teichoic acid export membrane protein
MVSSQIKYVTNSFAWGVVSKFLDAGLKFITIPLLLNYFGKENYGLLTLAIATNAYMQLLNMGMNTGAVKFFSQWIAIGNYEKINRVSRTNLSFYLGIGLINSSILITLAFWGETIFNVTPEQFISFRYLLWILAGFSIINWIIFVFNQLLIADEKIGFTQQILSIRSILSLLVVGITILLKLSIIQYFSLNLVVNSAVIIPYYYKCKRRNLIQSILPAFYWQDFKPVIRYSLAIFAMSLFQFTATQSRPLVLGIFSNQGVSILSEYRVIEVFPIFIISIGGMLISILLPKTSRAIQANNRNSIQKIAYEGTKYTSILVSFLCFPIILNATELLTLYVGEEYSHLANWLILWVLSLTLFLHNTPVASLVLATGKTRMLVYSSAIACIVSIVINAVLCTYFDVGSAVIGYLVYIIIQMSFYYFYFNQRILELNSLKIFTSFILPTAVGLGLMLGISFLKFQIESLILLIMVKSLLWGLAYIVCLQLFGLLNLRDLVNRFKQA